METVLLRFTVEAKRVKKKKQWLWVSEEHKEILNNTMLTSGLSLLHIYHTFKAVHSLPAAHMTVGIQSHKTFTVWLQLIREIQQWFEGIY